MARSRAGGARLQRTLFPPTCATKGPVTLDLFAN
jgi:hypothetical protein